MIRFGIARAAFKAVDILTDVADRLVSAAEVAGNTAYDKAVREAQALRDKAIDAEAALVSKVHDELDYYRSRVEDLEQDAKEAREDFADNVQAHAETLEARIGSLFRGK